MEHLIVCSMGNVVNYFGWVIFWTLFLVVPSAVEVWVVMHECYNHKGYWLKNVDLEEYIDGVPIKVPKEE